MNNTIIGFNGQRLSYPRDTIGLGNGYRTYNPVLMRFDYPDSWSPFGKGGINSYIYCFDDPANRDDPSGHMSWHSWVGLGLSGTGILIGIIGLAAALPTSGLSLGAVTSISAIAFGISADAFSIASNFTSGRTSSSFAWASLVLGVGAMGVNFTSGLRRAIVFFKHLPDERGRLFQRIYRIREVGLGGLGSKRAGQKWAAQSERLHNIPKLNSFNSARDEYLFRGIRKGHPHEELALKGEVVPGNLDSTASSFDHNLGAVSNSPYTSWTRDPNRAKQFAGENGIILRVKVGAPEPDEEWSWVMSEDQFWESEILMKGKRTRGVEVFRP